MRLVVLFGATLLVTACGDNLDGTVIEPIDECAAATDDCVAPAAGGAGCTDTADRFTCGCAPGYTGDGHAGGTGCRDVDECAGTNGCVGAGASGTCTNAVGSYACGCATGFSGDGLAAGTGCTDIDECAGANDCVAAGAGGACTNAAGLYACGCATGFSGDGLAAGMGCIDVDECAGTNDCVVSASSGTCANTVGSYACGCAPGYAGDGVTTGTGCTDIDECAGANDCVAAGAGGVCTNAPGAYACSCAPGFTGDGLTAGTACADVDECLTDNGGCGVWDGVSPLTGTAQCVNLAGSNACEEMISVSPYFPKVFFSNPVTGLLIREIAQISYPMDVGTVTGVTSVAKHPLTGELYGVVMIAGQPRQLVKLDLEAGAITGVIGSLGSKFANLEFLPDGTLFGVTGNGASPATTLFTIDPTTAALTLQTALALPGDGECLAYDTDAQVFHHFSGRNPSRMETLTATAPFSFGPTITLATGGEIFSCDYIGNGVVRVVDIHSRIRLINVADGTDVPNASISGLADDFRAVFFRQYTPMITLARMALAGGSLGALPVPGLSTRSLTHTPAYRRSLRPQAPATPSRARATPGADQRKRMRRSGTAPTDLPLLTR